LVFGRIGSFAEKPVGLKSFITGITALTTLMRTRKTSDEGVVEVTDIHAPPLVRGQ
jgi:hypothetical protein